MRRSQLSIAARTARVLAPAPEHTYGSQSCPQQYKLHYSVRNTPESINKQQRAHTMLQPCTITGPPPFGDRDAQPLRMTYSPKSQKSPFSITPRLAATVSSSER